MSEPINNDLMHGHQYLARFSELNVTADLISYNYNTLDPNNVSKRDLYDFRNAQ